MKKIQKGGMDIQKTVERIPLASFVSGVLHSVFKRCTQGARNAMKQLNVREIRMGLALVFVVLVLVVLVLVTFIQKPIPDLSDTSHSNTLNTGEVIYHPFTGQIRDTVLENLPFVFAVMVENSYDAWPLSGVEDAFLVIEAPVEGSIPRFEAFFTSDVQVDEIGPVRSARPYYVDWVRGWNVIYAHVGGSPEALELITALGVHDINEFYNGSTFWRSVRRFAPHNVYTTPERLTKNVQQKGFDTLNHGFFRFMQPATEEGNVHSIMYRWFSQSSNYDVGWEFFEGYYTRHQGGAIAKSADGDMYQFKNIIFIESDIRSIDDVDRKRIRTSGEGNAIVFQNGHVIEAIWKKDDVTSPLKFYNVWDEEIALVAGNAWITVTDDLDRVSFN